MSLPDWVGSVDVDRAVERLEALPDAPRGKKVPLPYADRSGVNRAYSNGQIADAIRAAPVREVPIDGLSAIQHSVRPEQVLRYLRDPSKVPTWSKTTPTDVPIVVAHGGKRFLWDGHHRATAAILSGADSIRARLVDLDAEGGDDGPDGPR